MHRANPQSPVSSRHQYPGYFRGGLFVERAHARRIHHQDQLSGDSTARRQSGFTLVEIALVLVVIGLLIGGVLKGQEMILNAKLKRIEKEFTHISVATITYHDRYRQMPGDDSQAATRFVTYTDGVDDPTPVQINGNGDGTIDGDWIAALHSETSNFWKHLRASAIIPGSGNDASQPQNAYGGMIGTRDGSLLLSGPVIIFGQVEGTVARLIEARQDDGSPSSGSVQSDLLETLMNGDAISSAGVNYDDDTRYHIAISQ